MASGKNERVLNLLICLLGTRQYVTAEKIRTSVPGYDGERGRPPSADAFKRMFERDKAELRELGVEIETGSNSHSESEVGYRVSERASKLPNIDLSGSEAAAVVLATRLWQNASMESAAQGALLKLKASGIRVESGDLGPFPAQMRVTDPAFEQVLAAVHSRTALTFPYRGADDDRAAQRRLQPWGVVSWRGRWYVVGHDLDRDARRSFRLSRIGGAITQVGPPDAFERPRDVNLYESVAYQSRPRELAVRIRIHAGTADGLRRMAEDPHPDGPDIVVLFSDSEAAAGIVSRYGDAVEILDPPEARSALARRLVALAGWVSA